MSQPLVLAIEPDLRQAAIVKRIVREKALAEIAVVDSRDAAIETMRTCMPDVLLLSALMSPRDEDELMAHLRTLDNAAHLQTHTIPQLASSLGPGEERGSGGLFSAFRRKKDKDVAPVAGCDPEMFADEIRVYLQRAADKKRLQQAEHFVAPDMRRSASKAAPAAADEHDESAPAAESSSWSSPFEWKPSSGSSRKTRARAEPPPQPVAAPVPAPAMTSVVTPQSAAEPPAPVPAPAPLVAEPVVVEPAVPAPLVVTPAAVEPPAPALLVAAPEPVSVVSPIVEAPPASPVLHIAAHSDTAPAAESPVIAKAKPVDPPRPKPVAERGPKLTGRVQLKDLLRAHLGKEGTGRDRLGPLARWARAETPRAPKAAAVTSDDVRALISSLAVPSAVASVTYPSGCRLRRVRVPASPEQPAA